MKTPHLLQIDLLKGLAILCVLFHHTVLINSTPKQILANWTFGLAVPVFICILGLTMGMSFTRRGASTLRELFSKSYFVRRFDRIVYPVLLLILLEVVYGAIFFAFRGSSPLVIKPQILLGWLPIPVDGNYFVEIAIESIFMIPLIYYGYRRAPRLTLITCFGVNLAFQLAAMSARFWQNFYTPRVIALMALGLLIADETVADKTSSFSKRDRLILAGGTIGVFLLLENSVRLSLSPIIARQVSIFNGPLYGLLIFLGSMFYVAFLVLIGIKFLPRTGTNPLVRALARMGRLSYHIFLMQLVYFSLLAPAIIMTIHHYVQGYASVVTELIVNIVVCTALGIGFALFESYSKRALRVAKRTFLLPRNV